jgi:hypothetical protein
MLDNRAIGTGKPGATTWRLIERYRELTRNEGEPVF